MHEMLFFVDLMSEKKVIFTLMRQKLPILTFVDNILKHARTAILKVICANS